MKQVLKEKRIAVKVKKIDGRSHKYEIVPDSICLMKAGITVFERPECKIFGEDGKEVLPEGKFFWSVETIDPFHLVIDMF